MNGEIRQKDALGVAEGEKTHHPPTPLHFQTLIYNFNISNFHSGAHFPNVIFQFMSNSVTIFLNTAYDKLGGTVDMQFRWSVLQAQRQTHAGLCVFVSISVCSVFWRNHWEPRTPGKIGVVAKYEPQGYRSIILS